MSADIFIAQIEKRDECSQQQNAPRLRATKELRHEMAVKAVEAETPQQEDTIETFCPSCCRPQGRERRKGQETLRTHP